MFLVGFVSTLAGIGSLVFTDGVSSMVRFSVPGAVAVSPAGTLVVTDSGNNRIRLASSSGQCAW